MIEEALKKDQHDRRRYYWCARLRIQDGQSEGLKAAIEDLKEVLRQEPNYWRVLLYGAGKSQPGAIDRLSFAGDLRKLS